MQRYDIAVLLVGASLAVILAVNLAFPTYVDSVSAEEKIYRRTGGYGVVDQNGTLYDFGFVSNLSDYDLQTQDDIPTQPIGWFTLAVRIPFEVDSDWKKISAFAIFSTGTYGGVVYYWTVNWRIYNSSRVALSNEWSDSLWVSADTPVTLWKNITNNIERNNVTSSVYTPGRWCFEVALTIHNATLSYSGRQYDNYYSLFLEVAEESLPMRPSSISLSWLFSTVTAAVTTVFVVVPYAITTLKEKRRKPPIPPEAAR